MLFAMVRKRFHATSKTVLENRGIRDIQIIMDFRVIGNIRGIRHIRFMRVTRGSRGYKGN